MLYLKKNKKTRTPLRKLVGKKFLHYAMIPRVSLYLESSKGFVTSCLDFVAVKDAKKWKAEFCKMSTRYNIYIIKKLTISFILYLYGLFIEKKKENLISLIKIRKFILIK